MKSLVNKIVQLILVSFSCIACGFNNNLPQPLAVPARNNIYAPAADSQNEYSQWNTPTWHQKGDTLVAILKLMNTGSFNPQTDFLKVYCHELFSANSNTNLSYYTIFYLNSTKKAAESLREVNGKLSKQFYGDRYNYHLKFSLINSSKSLTEINNMGIGFRWFSRI